MTSFASLLCFLLALYHLFCLVVHFATNACLAGLSRPSSLARWACPFAHLATASVALYTAVFLF